MDYANKLKGVAYMQSPQKPNQSVINRALQKALNELCPKNEQDDVIEFYPDIETLNTYAWTFTIYGKRTIALVYDYNEKRVFKVPMTRL